MRGITSAHGLFVYREWPCETQNGANGAKHEQFPQRCCSSAVRHSHTTATQARRHLPGTHLSCYLFRFNCEKFIDLVSKSQNFNLWYRTFTGPAQREPHDRCYSLASLVTQMLEQLGQS